VQDEVAVDGRQDASHVDPVETADPGPDPYGGHDVNVVGSGVLGHGHCCALDPFQTGPRSGVVLGCEVVHPVVPVRVPPRQKSARGEVSVAARVSVVLEVRWPALLDLGGYAGTHQRLAVHPVREPDAGRHHVEHIAVCFVQFHGDDGDRRSPGGNGCGPIGGPCRVKVPVSAGLDRVANAVAFPLGTVPPMEEPNGCSPPDLVALRPLVVEQVMRATGDEWCVWEAAAAVDPTELLAALGRMLPSVPLVLVAGCPILAALGESPLGSSWRSAYPPRPGSLWEELETYRALHVPVPSTDGDPMLELVCAREALSTP
jgi:hypothetical protein